MTDIVELVLADHRRIRQLREALGDAARYSAGPGPDRGPAEGWARLAGLIEAHISAEQEICWLPMSGAGPRAREQVAAAITVARDIRVAIGEARLRPDGSPGWWRAVNDAVSGCAALLGCEEDGILADFARCAGRPLRDRLGRQWLAFAAARRRDEAASGPDVPVCQICGRPLPGNHPHVLDAGRRAVWCTCRACAAGRAAPGR